MRVRAWVSECVRLCMHASMDDLIMELSRYLYDPVQFPMYCKYSLCRYILGYLNFYSPDWNIYLESPSIELFWQRYQSWRNTQQLIQNISPQNDVQITDVLGQMYVYTIVYEISGGVSTKDARSKNTVFNTFLIIDQSFCLLFDKSLNKCRNISIIACKISDSSSTIS